jgi:hypothetical protein
MELLKPVIKFVVLEDEREAKANRSEAHAITERTEC